MRIGAILTCGNVIDPEPWDWCPSGVTPQITRPGMADDHACVGSSPAARRLDRLEDATRSLLDISPELWLTTCTSGSLIDSRDGECRIRDSILAAGTPAR